MRLASVALLLLALLAGCKSADELYQEGEARERRGEIEAAFYRYASALDKQPDLRKAQGRLLETGRVAVGQRLVRIESAEDTGAWVAAADEHHGLDALTATARRAGVALEVPEGYAQRRRANFDAAIAVLLDEGDAAAGVGRFADALAGFERARAYEPTAEHRALLADAALDATAGWAEAEFAAGNFRAAHDRAVDALALAGPDHPLAPDLAALRDEAVALGSARVAFFPPGAAARAERALPDGFLPALADELDRGWSRPPLFVLVTEPSAVRRALRDFEVGRRIGVREAARVGRALDAHFAFASEVVAFERTVEERERTQQTARTRGGERVTWDRVEEDVTMRATVAFDLVDTAGRESVCEREIEHRARGRIVRGEYGGSLRTLDLDRDARDLFDADALAEREREIEDDLLDGLAERIADAAFACVPSD